MDAPSWDTVFNGGFAVAAAVGLAIFVAMMLKREWRDRKQREEKAEAREAKMEVALKEAKTERMDAEKRCEEERRADRAEWLSRLDSIVDRFMGDQLTPQPTPKRPRRIQ